MILQAIKVFKQLRANDFKMLAALEHLSRRYEYVPVNKLPRLGGFTIEDAHHLLSRLNKFKLVARRSIGYIGYCLLPAGWDALAIRKLVDDGVLEAFGKPLGIGKEADIYDALTPSRERVAVKFNRLGRTSFTRVKRARPYGFEPSWIYASQAAARLEFEVLRKLYPTVSVPRPIARDRHVLVMGLIDGVELANVVDMTEPEIVLEDIIENIKHAYQLGVVHADLSEHNILIKPDGTILIIDWPQWVPANRGNSTELLERDISNILKFFRRKFGLKRSLHQTLQYIMG
ncbi:MAG: AarF/UbiB family protein [Hadesarchaea archaeon]|nr:AarF/UbiB family protein [Hadesarchaea archaeon]